MLTLIAPLCHLIPNFLYLNETNTALELCSEIIQWMISARTQKWESEGPEICIVT
ncbi:hypothetical protein [Streptococcus pantholopis]|uniref:hypothetical protein n=1 Tax=Streptococcus pantholopis TaxID=1811193 RepID=UPI000B1B4BF5|nr:hypothetical protein [Streptococcus pantholopis]